MHFLSPFDPGISVVPLVFAALLLGATPTAAGRCRSERCSREFERTRQTLDMVETASPGYCRALSRFTACLSATKSACLGNLYFHTNLKILQRKSAQLECDRVMAEAGNEPEPAAPASTPPPPRQDSICSYHGDKQPAFCGLFGDPHLRTFWGSYQTCRVLGAWPLIDNAYLAVQVTNEPVGTSDQATAPTKLTVIVKQNAPCTPQLTYEARADLLPSSFVDGAVSSGVRSEHSVRVHAVVAGQHTEISIRHINATLAIRRVGGHLTFAARLPQSVAEQSAQRGGLQLCARGCPSSEQIDYRHVLSAGRPVHTVHGGRAAVLTRDTIAQMCRNYRLTDYYLDACVFDVLITGKTMFIEAARDAQGDLHYLMPQAIRELANRTELDLSSRDTSGARGVGGGTPLVALVVMMGMFLVR